jgi:protocatechuate 3,4-dioxygenase beta subunit
MRVSCRPIRPAALAALVLIILTAAILALPSAAAAATVQNAAGRYDTLVLRDLGGKQAALVQLIAEDGAFTQRELWRSKKGAFDARRASFVAGDVDGNGIADGIVLYDLGGGRSRLFVYPSDGFKAKQVTAWTSKPKALARAKAKLAVGDLDHDGRDDLLALYDRGRSGVALYRFLSTGSKFRQSLAFSARSGLAWSKAQLAAGDVTGDGRSDGLVLYAPTAAKAQLLVFSGTGATLAKQTFWSGNYAAGRARLAAGDVDSDGDCDVVCLYRRPDNGGRLDVFLSSGKALAGPHVWYEPGATPVPTASHFGVGDVTGDGRADALTAAAAGAQTRVTTWVSSGSGFVPEVWLAGPWPYARVSLGVAPSAGLVVSDKAEPLNNASMRYLREVEADGTLAFAGETGQLARLEAGDVLLAPAGPEFPAGLCRRVVSVGEKGGQVVVETAQAELCDVIDQGEVAFHMHLTADDLPDDGIRAPGVSIVRDESPPVTFLDALGEDDSDGITFTLTSPIGDWAEAEGSITIDPDAHCDWSFGWGGLDWAYYTQVLNTTTDVTVSMKKDVSGTKDITLYKRTLTPITIMVGVVPVVILPEFEVKVGVDGQIVAGVTAGMTLTTNTWATISWDGDWDLDCGSDYEATPKPPRIFGQLTVTGFASAGLDFEVYGVAGPTAELKPYVELAADTQLDPWWTLSAGLKGEIGLEVELFDHGILNKTFTLDALGPWIIDQAGSSTSGGGPSEYEAPSVRGKILDAMSGQPVKWASVEIAADGSTVWETSSAADGTYVFCGLSAGTYTVTAGKEGYADNQRTVVVVGTSLTTGQDISLTREELQGITGHVFTDAGHYPIFMATVRLYDADGYYMTDWTYADGSYSFTGVDPGNYRVVASANYCHPESVTLTLAGGQLRENIDLFLVNYTAQGLFGRVVDKLTGDPLEGALVKAREGDADGAVVGWVHTAADGSFVIDAHEAQGIAVGAYSLSFTRSGYEESTRAVVVARGRITDVGVVPLKEVGGLSMRSQIASCIRWPEGLPTMTGRGTYEFWFRPFALIGTEWGNQVAQVSWDYPDWMGDGLHRLPGMVIAANDVPVGDSGAYATVLFFRIVENVWAGDPNEPGTYHTIHGTTPLVSGRWYHVAAQYGPSGMRLFVNGHLEASNDYAGAPEPFDGAAGGQFTLGEYYCEGQGRPNTAGGDYKGLVVREWDYYEEDFTPYEDPSGSDALVYDALHGMTNGENLGFVPTP